MKLWDLVEHQKRFWVVAHLDANTQTATLRDPQGRTMEVPTGLDGSAGCRVIANPPEDWPFVMVRDNPKGKTIQQVYRVVRHNRVPLTMFVDWCPSDPARPGGALFLNPALGLLPAETVLIGWAAGAATSLQVPLDFLTVAERVASQTKKVPLELTGFDRLLEDRFGDDE